MKKSLIALAALAVVSAASAQSSTLTISGYIDRGYTDLNSSNAQASTRSLASSAGTTSIFVKGTEDLGAGNVVGFSVETDWQQLGGDTQSSSYSTAQNAGFANGESFASLGNATLGTVKLGAVNSFMLGNLTGVASPAFSTGVGSVNSNKYFSIFNGIGTGSDGNAGVAILATNGVATGAAGVAGSAVIPAGTKTTGTGARDIRISNTVNYTSPVFSGFSAGVAFALPNNNISSLSGATNTVGMNEYVLNYANGPLKVVFDSIQYKVGSNGTSQSTGTVSILTGGTSAANVSLAANLKSTHNLLAASYAVLPELTVNVGFGSFTSSDDLSKGKSVQAGATYVIGAVDLMAQYAKVNDNSASNIDRTLLGLGANYNLSKTARVYFRYDNMNLASNQTAYIGSEIKRTAVGVSKSF